MKFNCTMQINKRFQNFEQNIQLKQFKVRFKKGLHQIEFFVFLKQLLVNII